MTTTNLIIRKAEPRDRKHIEALWDNVLKDAFQTEGYDEYHNPEHELEFKMGQLDEAFTKKTSHYVLAFEGEQLVGTIAYGTPPNRGILRRTGDALLDTVEVGSLYIEPSLQKKGYGRTLLIYVLEDLLSKGVDTVCFDSIIETSKQIWRRMFGEPKYTIKSKKHDFNHMIWVVDVETSLKRLKSY